MDTIKPLFTATATSTGGRNGHTEASDGSVKADLSVPKAMGGPGKPNTTTPEHLFAAGYAACFGGALDFVAKQQHKDATKARITCAVSIGPRDGGGFGLAVTIRVEDPSLPQAELGALVFARDLLRSGQVENGRPARTEESPLVTRRQKPSAPVEGAAFNSIAVAENDVTGEVAAFASQTVGDPGTGTGEAGTPDAGVDLIERGDVIVRFGVKRLDEPEIVDMFGYVWIFLAHPRARLPILLEAEWRLHQRARIAIEDIDVDPLAVALREFRLRIEQIHRAGSPFHEQPNDRFGFWRIMRRPRRHRIDGSGRFHIGRE